MRQARREQAINQPPPSMMTSAESVAAARARLSRQPKQFFALVVRSIRQSDPKVFHAAGHLPQQGELRWQPVSTPPSTNKLSTLANGDDFTAYHNFSRQPDRIVRIVIRAVLDQRTILAHQRRHVAMFSRTSDWLRIVVIPIVTRSVSRPAPLCISNPKRKRG